MHRNGGAGGVDHCRIERSAVAKALGELRQSCDASECSDVVATLSYADDGFIVAFGSQDDAETLTMAQLRHNRHVDTR